jgi:CRP-like cAMP-binding protein
VGYLLLSGIVKISWVNQQERRVLVSLLPSGEFFGLGFLFPQKRQPFRSDAFSDCTVGVLKPETLVDILTGVSFEGYLRSIALTMGRMWGMCLRCVRGMGINLRKRVALELLELAAAFGVQDSRGTILSVRPTHEDLANSVGASRQKVSETLADFERQHVLRRDARRLIINPDRLREIVETG